MKKAKEDFNHTDPIHHPIKVGDYVLFTEVKRSSVFMGQVISMTAKTVTINSKQRGQVRKGLKGIYVVTEQLMHNKEIWPEQFI